MALMLGAASDYLIVPSPVYLRRNYVTSRRLHSNGVKCRLQLLDSLDAALLAFRSSRGDRLLSAQQVVIYSIDSFRAF